MEEKVCGNCGHFRLHYIQLSRGHYMPLLYGHCVCLRQKKKEESQPACLHWAQKRENEIEKGEKNE